MFRLKAGWQEDNFKMTSSLVIIVRKENDISNQILRNL